MQKMSALPGEIIKPGSEGKNFQVEKMVRERKQQRKERSAGFCPNCGDPVQKSDCFCPKCGKKIGI